MSKTVIADNYSSHSAYLFCICWSYESCSSFKRNLFREAPCDLFSFPKEIGGSFFWTIMVPYVCFCIWTYHLCLIVYLFISTPAELGHCEFLAHVSVKALCLWCQTSLTETMVSKVQRWPKDLYPLSELCSWFSSLYWKLIDLTFLSMLHYETKVDVDITKASSQLNLIKRDIILIYSV